MTAPVKASSFTLKTIIDNTDKLITELEAAGYEAYYVGGCVRDHLMDRTTSDIDVTTSATPDEIKRVFAGCRVLETGIRHGTLTVFTEQIAGRFETADMASHPKGLPVEVTTFRTESGYSDSRHPDSVFFCAESQGRPWTQRLHNKCNGHGCKREYNRHLWRPGRSEGQADTLRRGSGCQVQ